MSKSTHFIGQPMLNQVIKWFNREKVLQFSRENGGERYVKSFDAWNHLVVMLYAVIMRFDSLAGYISVSTCRSAETVITGNNKIGIVEVDIMYTCTDNFRSIGKSAGKTEFENDTLQHFGAGFIVGMNSYYYFILLHCLVFV
ncbi:MAG: DUF4372 domain-containing protein [Prevotellaceae bacterium]|jgi:hypothetical protein|nr:DUF4372 domain-containing protein [Prevotellaceae bacterium]